MSQEHAPDDFDWVAAQAGCSASAMFEKLRAGVKEDVRRRNALIGRNDGWSFEVGEDDQGFDVARLEGGRFTGSRVAATVRFERAGRRIHVRGDELDVDVTAIVALDAAGACRFVVGEAIYAEWEIRRMALEQLFFEEPEEPG
jgi:hypothetical protein